MLKDTLWGPKACHNRVMFQAYAYIGAAEPAACTLQQGWQGLTDMSTRGLHTCPYASNYQPELLWHEKEQLPLL